MNRIIFITGTDTGVGKTFFAGLLLLHLRQQKIHAVAMKPFCCGGRKDVQFLQALQEREFSDAAINPFFFAQPLAPWVAGQKRRRKISIEESMEKIRALKSRCEVLLVEGCGGLMVPLGANYTLLDLIGKLEGEAVVVARNKLGVLNHTILTVRALQGAAIQRVSVALMGWAGRDISQRGNRAALARWLKSVVIVEFPVVRLQGSEEMRARRHYKDLKKSLARLLKPD